MLAFSCAIMSVTRVKVIVQISKSGFELGQTLFLKKIFRKNFAKEQEMVGCLILV